MQYFHRVPVEDTKRFDGPTCSDQLDKWIEAQARKTNGRFNLRSRHYNGIAHYAEASYTLDDPVTVH